MSATAPGYRPGTEEVRLSREMSGFSVAWVGVGAMIGAGIFVLTGIAAGVAGPGLLLAFGLNGIVTLFTAMAYAELGSCFHDAGGGYLWVKSSLPHPNGFLSGWMSWFAHAVACSLYALGFGAYFGHVLEGFGVHVPQIPYLSIEKTLAVAASLVFAYINFRGASETGKAGMGGELPAVPAERARGGLQRDGAHLHRLPGVRGHRPVQRGGGGPHPKHPPRHLPRPPDRDPHLPPGRLRLHRSHPERPHPLLEVPRGDEGAGDRRGGAAILPA